MKSENVILPEGWTLECLEETDSTNEAVKRRAAETGLDRLIVQADGQTAGRGRRGRAWKSLPGNLFFSLVLKVRDAARLGEYSFLTALALARAVEDIAPNLAPKCKWPNDVLLNGKKMSGILLETDGKHGIERLIVGVGVNIVPVGAEGMLYPVASLADEGCLTGMEEVLSAFMNRFDLLAKLREKEGFAPVLDGWKKRAYGLGAEIAVNLPDRRLTGTFSGLDKDGCLLLNNADGEYRITAGDVFFDPQGK